MKFQKKQPDADPLRILNFVEVIKRTGYSRSSILRYLAKDIKENCPGYRFPVPIKNRMNGWLEWPEKTIVDWIASRVEEANVA